MASDPTPDDTQHWAPPPLLSVRGLTINFGQRAPIVAGVDLDLSAGRLCALVGETGAGKSLVAMALAGLLPRGSATSTTRFQLRGRDLSVLDEDGWSHVRGRQIGVVFQDPFTALDPLMRIGDHFAEAIHAHVSAGRQEIVRRTVESLVRVGLPGTERIVRALPGELSGGMRQRIQIALALVHDPPVLIADEPTASLDVEARDGIIDLIAGLCRLRRTSALLVSHDLQSVRSRADDVLVMVQGRVVEAGSATDIFERPRHPFTSALLAAENVLGQSSRVAVICRPDAPAGCRYYGRCPAAEAVCAREEPRLQSLSASHAVACHVMLGHAL
ncbi:MAG: ABC transporter ATP-binding protein [Alsobacter sp.]